MSRLYKQATSHLPSHVSGPRSWLSAYESFVSSNSSSVSQIESALRSLTYIIPGRFKEAELASESLHSLIQLLSLYHTSLLHRLHSHLPPSPRSLHNRYTHFWTSSSPLYTRVATLLQTIQYTELLWEMLARRGSNKTRWRIVVFLEALKAFCRLVLIRLTRGRMGVSPALPERQEMREEEGKRRENEEGGMWEDLEEEKDGEKEGNGHVREEWGGKGEEKEREGDRHRERERKGEREREGDGLGWTMPRTGLRLLALPDTSDVTAYLLKNVLTADDIKRPKQLLHKLTTAKAQIAETMWVLRPLVYAILMQKLAASRGRAGAESRGATAAGMNKWTPWVVGVGLEVAARQLAKGDLRERLAGGLRGLTGLEREEFKRRGWGMGWWVLRGAFYEEVTSAWIRGFAGKLKGRLLLDMVATIVEDYDYLWDEYYFSTATM